MSEYSLHIAFIIVLEGYKTIAGQYSLQSMWKPCVRAYWKACRPILLNTRQQGGLRGAKRAQTLTLQPVKLWKRIQWQNVGIVDAKSGL
jgi:hypothetical protein